MKKAKKTPSALRKQRFHRLLTLFLIVITPLFVYKGFQILKIVRSGGKAEYKYSFAKKKSTKHDFLIIISSNSGEFVEKNLGTIFDQTYPNYRVLYLDLASKDQAAYKAKTFARSLRQENRLYAVRCETQEQYLNEYIHAVRSCRDNEIIVQTDGGDWLANSQVLDMFNETYQSSEVWLTYGEYLEYPSYKRVEYDSSNKRVMTQYRMQNGPWMRAPLKTYYASLFKQVNLESLSGDQERMLMLSIYELAKNHVHYIPEVLSIHAEERGNSSPFLSLSGSTDS